MKESRLTPRELAVLKLMFLGKSNKQIASIMYVSVYTVKNHVHNILNKLNAESRAAAVHYACSKPWILPKIDSD
jgi:two-component system response regulator DegU